MATRKPPRNSDVHGLHVDWPDDTAAIISAMANAVEGKDLCTCGHVQRVAEYSVVIGKKLGLDGQSISALRTGGLVHDIGKIGIPDRILNKPSALTREELVIMRRHPVIGYDILATLQSFEAVLPIVRWHHEKPSGRGYPDAIGGRDIPLLARIAAVADVFDALSSNRPYRPALPPNQCGQILLQSAQDGDLDAELVAILLETVLAGDALLVPHAAA